jgi:hypothetical protein
LGGARGGRGPAGPAPTATTTTGVESTAPLPAALVTGTPRGVAPLTVLDSPLGTVVLTRVRFGTHAPLTFAPDTGSSQSVVDTGTAANLSLSPVNVDARQETVCSTITISEVSSGPWSVGGVALVPQALGTLSLGPVSSAGFSGLLGSDAMRRFGSVVFDYAGGRLILGAG